MALLRQSSNYCTQESSQLSPEQVPLRSSFSLQVASMVAQCSVAAQMATILPPKEQSAHLLPAGFGQPACASPRELQLSSNPALLVRSRSITPPIFHSDSRLGVESKTPQPHYRPSPYPQSKQQKLAQSSCPTSHPVKELRTIVPQSHTVDQARSIVFGKAPDQPLGVSVTALLRRKGSLYGGDQPLNRAGSATLFLEWPGYKPTTTHIRFENPMSPYLTHPGHIGRKIRLEDFATTLAEKVQLWLCLLSRQQYEREEKDWELATECVPPLDELVLVAIGPMHPAQADEMWGIVLQRIKRF